MYEIRGPGQYARELEEEKRLLERKRIRKELEEFKHKQRVDWLTAELDLAKAPVKVVLTELPKPLKPSISEVARIGFWATKTKVCKPYSR